MCETLMKKILYLLLLLSSTAAAQKITVKGRLLDDSSTPLPSATVMLLNPTDSSLVNFSISNADGFFEMKNLVRANYLLRVTYVGLANFAKMIEPKEAETVVELGDLLMVQQSKQLNEVVVKGEMAPVTIKKDTIEFNAPSFKTKENANVEDLLKKLPGVEVESDGTIIAQGEQVQQVTVDGKEFFGRDPKIATQNLPAKAVDKVQIFDKKSDQTTFSGIDDGQRQKTINLELKEEYKNGFFGNATGGYGTDKRYTGRLSLNRFKKGQQLSFLAMGNNVNEQGFSIDDYMNFSGGSQQMMGGRGGGGVRLTFNASGGSSQSGAQINFGNRLSGIMSNYAGGVNFNQDFSKKTTLQSNYFYNQLDHEVLQDLTRENFFGDSSTFLTQQNKQYSSNYNHRVNAVLDHKLDSANSIKLTTSFSSNQSESHSTTDSQTRSDEDGLINDGTSSAYSAQNTNNFNTHALLRHRFAKKGRTISSTITFGYSEIESDGAIESTNTFYKPFTVSQQLNQLNNQLTENTALGATVSYTEPLGNRRYVELNYNFNQNLNEVDRKVYDVEDVGDILNEDLSAVYKSDYQYHRPGFNFRINRNKYSLTLGTSMQSTSLHGDIISTGESIMPPTYNNFLPMAHFNYELASTKNLSIDYETTVQEPSITQLQPIVNNSDPLNQTIGNSKLRPAYQHSVRTNFTLFNPASFVNFFAFVNATYTQNAITYAQSIDSRGVRISKPINVSSNKSVRANASVSFPLNPNGSRISLSANTNQQFGINILNDVESEIAQNTLASTLRYSYRYKEIFDWEVSGTISRNATDYEFNTSNNQLYYNNTYRTEGNVTFLKNYQLSSSFELLIYDSKSTDFAQQVELWNVAISRYVLKNRAGEIKVSANNLLDNNFGVDQTANINYIERTNTNNLGRYFLLSFTYAINKQLNPMAGRRPSGGMRMMIRN